MTATDGTDRQGGDRFYGRRKGKPLRPGRQKLVDEQLPALRVSPDKLRAGQSLADLFAGHKRAYWLEIGFGGGEHLADMAAGNSDVGIIGCEPFINGVASLLSHIADANLKNVRIWDDDVRDLLPALPDAAFERIFLLYPDPWPKTRHHRRRFVNAENLSTVARLLAGGGLFRFASDHMGYVAWTLEHMCREPAFEWCAEGPADWRERPADMIETRYETKARRQGSACVYLDFRRRPR